MFDRGQGQPVSSGSPRKGRGVWLAVAEDMQVFAGWTLLFAGPSYKVQAPLLAQSSAAAWLTSHTRTGGSDVLFGSLQPRPLN